jgi:hypothetical protein
MNGFQWSKIWLSEKHPEGLFAVQRFEADSKFFRSFVIVLPVLTVKTEVGCPQNTEVRCPLFTDEIVHSVGSARRIGCHLEQLGG